MKKYLSFFTMRLYAGLQYRTALLGGVATQLPWGLMECLAFQAFRNADPSAFPMEFSALVSYMWLKEAFFLLFTVWNADQDLFEMILKGDIAYELCRPVSLYQMWFAKVSAARISNAALRCVPILAVAMLLPEPFRLQLPKDPQTALLFAAAMVLGAGVTVAFCMIVYTTAFLRYRHRDYGCFACQQWTFCQVRSFPFHLCPVHSAR